MLNSLVSIITPSYNQGCFIEETLYSVKKQVYPNIEHIVIDGGSTDNTIDVLNRYEGKYGLRWISEPDEGHSDAVNKGFQMARGDIIGWLNSDDVYFDHRVISRVVKTFEEHPEVDIVYGDCAYISENDLILRIQCVPDFRYSRLLRSCFIEQPAVFFRKNVIEKERLDKRIKVAIDYEFWLRIGKNYNFYHYPRILAADRNHSGRISVANKDKLQEVSAGLRKQYLPVPTWKHHLEWGLDKLISGVPRRIKGLFLLFLLSRKKDYTFDAKVNLNLKILKYQIFGASLERMLS